MDRLLDRTLLNLNTDAVAPVVSSELGGPVRGDHVPQSQEVRNRYLKLGHRLALRS